MALYDVMIVGGGPAGAAAAIQLRQSGFTVLIIEATDMHRQRLGENFPPGIKPMLERLQLWQAFQKQGHHPCFGMVSFWGSDQSDIISHILNPHADGWLVDRRQFDRLVLEAAEAAGTRLFMHTRAHDLSYLQERGRWTCTLETPTGIEHCEARFLINAAGRANRLHERLGEDADTEDDLIALGAHLPPGQGKPVHASQIEAVENGWWYSAALPQGGSVLTLFTDRDIARDQGLADTTGWLAALAKAPASKRRHGTVTDIHLHSAPAFSRVVSSLNHPAYMAAGDALASFDPLSGEGIVRCLQTAWTAGLVASEYLHNRGNPGKRVLPDLQSCYRQYLAQKQIFYGLETRWPTAPFWHRRQAAQITADQELRELSLHTY